MPNRSTKIQGKVLRNLKRHGQTESESLAEEIYSELQDAQDNIISTIEPSRNITITLKTDEETYPLTSETVVDPALTTYKGNISSVKVIKQPRGFLYAFRILSNVEFVKFIDGPIVDWGSIANILGIDLTSHIITGVEMVGTKNSVNVLFSISETIVEDSEEIFFNGVLQIRGTDYTIAGSTITIISGLIPFAEDSLVCNYIKFSALGKTIVGTYQPLIGTVVDGRFRIYPIPTSEFNDLEIELYVYMKTSAGTIDATNVPELDEEYDKALEYFATSSFLIGTDSDRYMVKFDKEKERLQHLQHKAKGTMQRETAYYLLENERRYY